MRRVAALIMFAALFLTATSVHPQTQSPRETGTFEGDILDPSGAVVNTYVLIHSGRAGNPINQELAQDRDGKFKAQLAPGRYDLFICAPGIVPIADLVQINSGKRTELKVRPRIDFKHGPKDLY